MLNKKVQQNSNLLKLVVKEKVSKLRLKLILTIA